MLPLVKKPEGREILRQMGLLERMERMHRDLQEILKGLDPNKTAAAIEGNLSPEEAVEHIKIRMGNLPKAVVVNIDHKEAARESAELKRKLADANELVKLAVETLLETDEIKKPEYEGIRTVLEGVKGWEDFKKLMREVGENLEGFKQLEVPPEYWGEEFKAKHAALGLLTAHMEQLGELLEKELAKRFPKREETMAERIAKALPELKKRDVKKLVVFVGAQHAERLAKLLREKHGIKNVEVHNLVRE